MGPLLKRFLPVPNWKKCFMKKLCPTLELLSTHYRTANKNVNFIALISSIIRNEILQSSSEFDMIQTFFLNLLI